MTARNIILTVLLLLAVAAITALIDRWQYRRRLLGRLDWSRGDEREIDILKRGEICPWPRDF